MDIYRNNYPPVPPPTPENKQKNSYPASSQTQRGPVQLFSGISNVRRGNTYETFSLHLQNSIRDGEVGNYLFLTGVRFQRGIGGPDTPPPPKKKKSQVFLGFVGNKHLRPAPHPSTKLNKQKKNSSQTYYRLRRPVNLLRLSENSIRDREVGNYLFLTHARIQRGLGGPDPPPPQKKKITRYIGFYRNKDLQPPPPPPPQKKKKKKSCTPGKCSTLLNRKNIVAKKPQKTPLSEFFLLFESGRPRPLFLSVRRGWRGRGYYNIFIHTWAQYL